MQPDAAINGPSQHRKRNHFRAVIHNDGLRVAAQSGDRIEHTGHALAGESEIGLEGKVLARAVVAYG